ncbi:MAG TPA: TonB-dependent receptor, partial [Vicinamibacteria bacterium]|nr:TonB-dependent receptor [Vicinamibacteria bacterium]
GTFDLVAKSNLDPLTGRPLPAYQDIPSLVPEVDRTVGSLFVQDAWNATPKVGVTAGLRMDSYTDYGAQWSPRAAAVYRLGRDANVKAGYSRAVRTPSFGERFFSTAAVRANPDLEPATANTLDLSLLYRRKDLRVVGTLFASSFDDLIVPAGPAFVLGRPQRLVNLGGIASRGLELEAVRELPGNRQLNAWYAFASTEDEATGEAVVGVPRHLLRLGAFFPAGAHLLVSPSVTFHGGRTRAAGDSREDVEGYALFDLVVRVKNLHPRLELAGSVHNLFDVDYVDPSPLGGLPGDYPRPGIAAYVKVRYRF